ncbi:MAG: GNAT family N-acetyltransferase [Spirochaetaceae bacterium]|nr:GNAT family N-acetyltransferase [Spirochaetaceae bacterium]
MKKFRLQHSGFAVDELYGFLVEVDNLFPIHLSQKIDLRILAEKYFNSGDCIGICDDNGEIVALVAGYINDRNRHCAYISVLAVKPQFQGLGFSKKLLSSFIRLVINHGFKIIAVYTHKTNCKAYKVYYDLGFRVSNENKERRDDYYLIKEL